MIVKRVFYTTVALVVLSLSQVFALDCPKFPEQAKKDWEVMVAAEALKIGPLNGAELKTTTRNVTRDLFANLPDAGRVYLEQMMLATYCSSLRDDKTLTDTEKSKRIKEYIAEVRKVIRAQNSTRPKSKPAPAKKELPPDTKNLLSSPPPEKNSSVTSIGQTGGITANNVNINLQQQARVIQTIEGNIECIFSGNWKIHPGDITPMMWNKAETYAYIYVRDAGETGAILFSLENIKMAKLPDGNLKVNIEIRAKPGTGALGSELDVLRNYSHLYVFIPFIGRDATIDNELILRKQSVSLFVNGERKSQFTDAPLTNFKIPIPEDGKAVGFWYEKINLFNEIENLNLVNQDTAPIVTIRESKPEITNIGVNHLFVLANNGKMTATNLRVEIVCFSKDIIDVNFGDNSEMKIEKEPIEHTVAQKVFLSARRLVATDRIVFTIRSTVDDFNRYSKLPLPIVNSIIFDQGKGQYLPYTPKGKFFIGSEPPPKNL